MTQKIKFIVKEDIEFIPKSQAEEIVRKMLEEIDYYFEKPLMYNYSRLDWLTHKNKIISIAKENGVEIK